MPGVATFVCPGCRCEFPHWESTTHKCSGSNATRSKYRVAAKEKRTHNGVVYASALEMKRAKELDLLRANGTIIEWFRQCRKPIGCEEIVTDFVVIDKGGAYVEEVKGHETADWKRHLRWWKANGRIRLVILKASRGGWEREQVMS